MSPRQLLAALYSGGVEFTRENFNTLDAALAASGVAAPVKFNAWPDAYPDGMTEQDVKNELHDYQHMLNEVPKVYDHVTGGLLTKTNYFASVVIGEADNHLNRMVEEALEEQRDEATPSQPVAASPFYMSGPYPDGSMSVCELTTGRVLHKFTPVAADAPEALAPDAEVAETSVDDRTIVRRYMHTFFAKQTLFPIQHLHAAYRAIDKLAAPVEVQGAPYTDGAFLVPGVPLPALPCTEFRLWYPGNTTGCAGYTAQAMAAHAAHYGQAVAKALAGRPAPAAEAEPSDHTEELSEAEIGAALYRGNTVSFMYDKARAYGDALTDTWDVLKEFGHRCDGQTRLQDKLREVLTRPAAPLSEVKGDGWCPDCQGFGLAQGDWCAKCRGTGDGPAPADLLHKVRDRIQRAMREANEGGDQWLCAELAARDLAALRPTPSNERG